MTQTPPSSSPAEFVPLSAAEQRRLRSLLEGDSTRTLLLSLLELTRGNQDADLIVATLIDRLPFPGHPHEPPADPDPTRP